MADNKGKSEKKEPVKYRFGQNDIDLNKYILNLGHNVLSYIDSLGWNDGQKEEFMNAYNLYLTGLKDLLTNGTSRFSTDDFGTIIDSTGTLNNTDNDNIDPVDSEYYYDNAGNKITTDDYNLLKKRKLKNFKTFAANREVATYFNKIGRAIGPLPKETIKEKEKEKFSISKHGFLADWLKRNGASGEKIDLTPYLDKDKYDPVTKKRARTNRIAYLQLELSNYIKNLDGDYDFEGSSFKSMDDYKAKLQSLIDNMNDGWSNSDMIAANLAGIGGSFYNYFFTEDETPGITAEETKTREEEDKKKALLDAQNKWIDELIAIYDKNGYQWHHNNQHNLGKVDSKYWSPETGWNGEAFRNSFLEGSPEWTKYYNKDTKQFDYQTYFNDYLANPFSKEGKRAIAGLIGNGYAQQLLGGKYQGMYYIPQYDRDRRTNSGLVYDPLNGRLFYTFIGDIPDLWNKMIEEYKLANGLIERRDSYKFKEGGSIEMMLLGGGFDANAWMEEDRQKGLEAKGVKNGRTTKQQEAGDRVIGIMGIGVKDTAQNPNNGFSGKDYLRLGSIAADIVSMGSAFVPGVGSAISAVAGASSSLGTFFADAFEDGLDSGDFKNLGLNLGMDVLGLIPGGGSASKGIKIAKNLAQYTSRIMAAIGAMSTLANGLQIINSFEKLSTPSELTVDDWRNISAGLGLITGGVAAGTRKYLKAKMKAANTKPDNIAVEMVSKDGAKKTVLFNGEDAKAIRTAKDAKAVKDITSKYEDYKDWEVSTTGGLGWRGFKGDEGKWLTPVGLVVGKARVFDVSNGYNMLGNQTGKVFANRGKWEADIELTPDNNSGKTIALVDSEVQAFKDQLLEPMKKASRFTNIRKAAREKSATKHDELILRLDDLLAKAISKKGKTPSGKPGTGEGLNAAEFSEYKYLKKTEPRRKKQILDLRNWLKTVKADNYHTQAYNDFKTAYVNSEGNVNIPVPGTRRSITGTFEELIKDLGIFKEGGSLNIDKVRKFKEAGKITNTTSKANWFTDMYSSPEMTKWLNTFNTNNFENFNNLQRSWATNKTNSGYSTGMSYITTPKNLGVWDRQALWNLTGTNAAIERAFNSGKITRAGMSGDNKENNYLDGFFGEQEFLRHGGTKESWAGKDNELKALQASLAKRGLSYTLDNATGMYLLGKLQGSTENNITNPVLSLGTPGKTTVKTPEVKSNDENVGRVDVNYPNNVIIDNPTLRYGLPRALYANKMNRKITDLAIDSEKPFLLNPFLFHRNVQSDLDAEMLGLRSAANLNSMASKPLTSDGNLQTAAMLEAQAKGLEFINLGKEKSNAAYRQSSELAWQLEKENAKNRHNTALVDEESLLKSAANKSKYEQAYLSKKYTNWDTLFQQLEYDAKTKAAENKAYEKSFALSDIHDTVTYDLENLARNAGVELTPEQLATWNKVLSGEATYSTLSDNERRNYLATSKIASLLENRLLRNLLGIPASKYSAIRTLTVPKTGWQADILEAKNGAKIVVADILAKTKDAERFLRLIKESIERNEKVLDRLSKSMYGYVKALIVK